MGNVDVSTCVTCVTCLTLVVLLAGTVSARDQTYSFTCRDDDDCYLASTVCYKDYIQCDVGTCGCLHGFNARGTCAVRTRGDTCTTKDQCPRGLDCESGRCACVGKLTIDGVHCLKDREILLGQECENNDICLHKTEDGDDYVASDVSCARGYCSCRQGLKQSGSTCRRIQPDEYGCITNADCSGDSLCKNGFCKCPYGHKIVTQDPPKCGKNNAMTDLAEGQSCDEMINKNRFCSLNLQCVTCGTQAGFRCRKYKSTRPTLSSASVGRCGLAAILLSLAAMLFVL